MSCIKPRKRTKVDIGRALPASAIRWTLAPLPPEKYVSDLELAVDAVVEARAYRELAQVAIGQLADLQERYENLQLTNRELRARQRTL